MRRILNVFSSVIVLSFALTNPSLAQSSADSTLKQQIVAFECNYTTVETGLGRVHASTCPYFAPIIEIIDTNWGRPVITGIYDAIHTDIFRIQVNNIWYVLGLDAELSANGNVWVLDLRGLNQPLPPGVQRIAVESKGNDGEIRYSEALMTIVDSTGAGEVKIPEAVASPARGILQISLIPFSFILLYFGLLLSFIIARRRRGEEDEWVRYYAIMHDKTFEWRSTTSQQEEPDETPH